MKVLNAKNIAKSRQQGFTIIELIVVILLLGILTATALPRFLDVTDEAHTAVVSAVQGGLATGVGLYRAGWFANGQDGVDVSQFGDGEMDASATGYPVGSADDDAVITESADCVEIFDGLLQASRPSRASAVYAADPESAIEGAAANVDFVVTTASVPSGTPAASTGCNFYYVGQYKQGESGTGGAGPTRTLPLITYTLLTGEVALSSFDLDTDQ